jgi:hypothetical protein
MVLGSWIAIIPAIAVLSFVFQDGFEVMLLPRRVHRRVRLTRFYFLGAWTAWCAIALRLKAGAGRERFLSVFGALSMVIRFVVWAAGLILGFGVLQWALQGVSKSPLTEQFYLSGVTFFTLGYGDVVPHTGTGRALSVVEAGYG